MRTDVERTSDRDSVEADGHKPWSGRLYPIFSGTLVFFGTLLRLRMMRQRGSLWNDELFSVAVSGQRSFHDTLQLIRADVHPPGYYLLLRGWMSLFPTPTETVVRMPSLLAGIGLLVLVAVLAPRVMPRSTALVWLAILVGSPIAIAYSTETRSYSLLLTSCAAGLICALGMQGAAPSRWWHVGLLVASAVASATHFFGALAASVAALTFGLFEWSRTRTRSTALRWLSVLLASCLPSAVWIAATWSSLKGTTGGAFWIPRPTWQAARDSVVSLMGGPELWWTLTAMVLLGYTLFVTQVPAGARLLSPHRPGGDRTYVQQLLFVPLAVMLTAYLVSKNTPIWTTRNLIVTVPWLTLAVALAARVPLVLARKQGRVAGATVTLSIAALCASVLFGTYAMPVQDWRGTAAAALRQSEGGNSLVISSTPWGPNQWAFYTDTLADTLVPDAHHIRADHIRYLTPDQLNGTNLKGIAQVLWLGAGIPIPAEAQRALTTQGFTCHATGFAEAQLLDCRYAG